LIFVADEGLDRPIVQRLRQDGHEVFYVAEMEPGISDDQVLDLANERGALLMTLDKDFGELVFRAGRVTCGVILVRLAGLSSQRKSEMVAAEIGRYADELMGAFTVIAPGQVRIRRRML
jgi:predicted nuclease of predicted toxin-antitoxin system